MASWKSRFPLFESFIGLKWRHCTIWTNQSAGWDLTSPSWPLHFGNWLFLEFQYRLYWVVLGWAGFYRVLPGFAWVSNSGCDLNRVAAGGLCRTGVGGKKKKGVRTGGVRGGAWTPVRGTRPSWSSISISTIDRSTDRSMAYLQVVCRRRRYLRGSNIGNSKKKRKKKQLKQKERNFFDCFFLFVVVVVLSISHLFFLRIESSFFLSSSCIESYWIFSGLK